MEYLGSLHFEDKPKYLHQTQFQQESFAQYIHMKFDTYEHAVFQSNGENYA